MGGDFLHELLDDLNDAQRQAVQHRDGPLLVLAGPGSGKTRVITRRAAALVRGGISPRNILAITFTNKAADEMRRRIDALGVSRGMWVHTFHALGVRLLREYGEAAGVAPGFSIYDESDQLRCAVEALAACGVSPQLLRPDALLHKISRAKNALQRPRELLLQVDSFENRQVGRLYEAYESMLRMRNALDFDDLLLRVALLLRERPDIADELGARFRYLLIDEYQDTNHAQYVIAHELSLRHENVCVTGDPDQSIYGWRGANIDNILNFERDHPSATVVRLEQNYRSHGAILAAADRLISHNRRRKEKLLWSELPQGAPVEVFEFAEDRIEAEHVAATIRELSQEYEFGEMAILYRTNAVSRGLEDALRARALPYRMLRGVEFYSRREIKDTVAYLRTIVNPRDDVSLMRIINTPTRGIGKTTLERLATAATRRGGPVIDVLRGGEIDDSLRSAWPKLRKFTELLDSLARNLGALSVSEFVTDVIERSGLEQALRAEQSTAATDEDRLANVQELVTAARRYEEEEPEAPTLEGFLQRVSLVGDQDGVDMSAGAVQMMTLHTAKGLEFPVVIIVGLEQGLLPHERALRSEARGEIEEERRLCFVGMTRAMRRLILTHSAQRLVRGVPTPRAASAFLAEISDAGVQRRAIGPKAPAWSPPRTTPRERGEFTERPAARRPTWDDEPVFSMEDPVKARRAGLPVDQRFADWEIGTRVRHAVYGEGQVVWIHAHGNSPKAGIRFVGGGERTLVLDRAPIVRVES